MIRTNPIRELRDEPILGRDAEIASLLATAYEARLVTVTGPVGVGKSRVAEEVAQRLVADGGATAVLRCNLHEVFAGSPGETAALLDAFSDPASRRAETNALATALGASEGGPLALGPLVAALAGLGEIVVFLDGADRCLPALRDLLGPLLDGAERALFLITSRERLGASEEHVFELEPLSLPVGEALDGPAAELFLRAARRSRPTYLPRPDEVPALVALLRELDGLPLALELLAPRLALFGAVDLLARLRADRGILAARSPLRGASAGRPRLQSLDDAVTSSLVALAPFERAALVDLAVFEGGFSLAAAEAVIDLHGFTADGRPLPAVTAVLEALRDRSLLQRVPSLTGGVRFDLLRAVREASIRLDEGAPTPRLAGARVRHSRWIVDLASKRISARHVVEERENLFAAARRVLDGGPVTARAAEPALRALLLLAPSSAEATPFQALLALVEPVLDVTQDSGADPSLVGRALVLRGAVRRRSGRGAAALKDLANALHVGKTLGFPAIEATAELELSRLFLERGDLPAASEHARLALAACRVARARLAPLPPGGDSKPAPSPSTAETGRRSSNFPMGRATEPLVSEAEIQLLLAAVEEARGDRTAAAELIARAVAFAVADEEPILEARARFAAALAAVDGERVDDARGEIARIRATEGLVGDPASPLRLALLEAAILADDPRALPASVVAFDDVAARARSRGLVALEAEALLRGALAAVVAGGAQRTAIAEGHARLRAAVETHAVTDGLGRILVPLGAIFDGHASRSLVDATAIAEARTRVLLAISVDPSAVVTSALGRAISHALAVLFPAVAPVASPPATARGAVRIGAEGHWCETPEGGLVSLERRRPLARILVALAKAHSQKKALSSQELQEAGWPGERMLASAGVHRVRVAVSTMRKLGVGKFLQTVEDGYRLDFKTAVVLADE
jgi:predicted ATPase